MRVAVRTGGSRTRGRKLRRLRFSGKALCRRGLMPTLALLAAIDASKGCFRTRSSSATLAIACIVAANGPARSLASCSGCPSRIFSSSRTIRRHLGMGDAKSRMIGLALGAQTLGAALIAFAGLLVAALYVLATRAFRAQGRDPFGPSSPSAESCLLLS